ncbi:hypothetical protein [Marinobacter sp. ELB17]|uniref:hypothetical protein n=1 Tax=Marinobacter sp. ELB17 TaxID=270374 RepID=UPI0000F38353|nr:hypothetical protein [Marinobacter sp. ELB17]EAZ98156.1 hypothetical protein MELB17_09738 [Marinobacter sp. ELB17]
MRVLVKTSVIMCFAFSVVGGSAQAESVEDYILKQTHLETLDHSIERYNRLITLSEAEFKLENVGKETVRTAPDQGAGKSRFFAPSMQNQFSDETGGEKRRQLTAEEEQFEAERIAKEKELGLMGNATIVEVFRNNGSGSNYGAVLEVKGRSIQVQPGDLISKWKIAKIGLDEITVINERYNGATVHIKQIR